MAWAYWLAAPVAATLLVALGSWLRGVRARAARRVTTAQAVRRYREFLDALAPGTRVAEQARPRPTQERLEMDS